MPKASTKQSRLLRLSLLAVLGFVLQNFPGHYTLRRSSLNVNAERTEGIAVAGMASADVEAVLYFQDATLQRISRNAQLAIPAGSTLRIRARTVPVLDAEAGRVVVHPQDAVLLSDKPLTFVYRHVPLARSRELRSIPGDPNHRVRVHGRYRMLTALLNLHRYRRTRGGPRREWRPPTRADISFQGELLSGHSFVFSEKLQLRTTESPQHLRVDKLVFDQGRWTGGDIELHVQLEDLIYQTERDALRLPRLDLTDPALRISLSDGESPLHLHMPAPLEVSGLHWTRTRPRETLRIEEARLLLSPFTFELRPGPSPFGRGEHLAARMEADSVRLARRNDQFVALEQGASLTLGAGVLTFADGEILVNDGHVTGSAGRIRGGRREVTATLQGTSLSVLAERSGEERFHFSGTLIPGENAKIRVTGGRNVPDTSLFADAEQISFSGDQDHFRIALPRLNIFMSRDEVLSMFNAALAEQRPRILEETREEISIGVDLREISSVDFAENQVTVRGAGRLYAWRDRIRTNFSVTLSVDFDLPEEVDLDEAEFGIRATLTGLNLANVNRRIEQLVLNRVRRPLLSRSRPLGDMVKNLPNGVRIHATRLHATDENLILELSGSVVLD